MSEYHRKLRGLSSHVCGVSPHVCGVRPRVLVARTLALGIGFLVRVSGLQAQGLWRDEVDQWRFAFEPLGDLFANFTRPGWNGPLYSPLLRAWISLTGESVFAMRFSSTLWGILGVALAYVVAVRLSRPLTRLWGPYLARAPHWVGFVMALLMTGSPYLVWYAQEIKMYTWVPMLVLLSLYCLDRAVARSRPGLWITVWGAVSLAFYSHILAALLIPVAVLWFLLLPARGRRPWGPGLVTLSGLTLPYLPLLSWQTALALAPRETGFARYGLLQMIGVLLRGWATGIWQGNWERSGALLAMMGAYGVLACLGLAALLALRYFRTAGRLVAWLGLPLLAVWLVSHRSPIFTDRYLIWSAPAFYLLIAIGVVWLGCRLSRLLVLVLVALLVVQGHGIIAQHTHPIKPQFAEAVATIEARREARDVLLFQIPYNHHVFAFYTEHGLGAWKEAPFTNWREPDGSFRVDSTDVGHQMRGLVRGYDRVWLIYSEAVLWDERELVKAWLDQTYVPHDVQEFYGVSLFLYTRPPRSN
jgi:mannosyltransferase